MPETTGSEGTQGEQSGQPQGGTTAAQGAGSGNAQGAGSDNAADTPESLKARIAELEKDNRRYRAQAKAREDAEGERTKSEQTEAERLAAKVQDLENKLQTQATKAQEQSLRLATQAAAGRLGFKNPDLAYRLLDTRSLQFGDDGEVPVGQIEAALTALAKSDPYLITASDFGGGPRGSSAAGDGKPSMSDLIRGAAQGR